MKRFIFLVFIFLSLLTKAQTTDTTFTDNIKPMLGKPDSTINVWTDLTIFHGNISVIGNIISTSTDTTHVGHISTGGINNHGGLENYGDGQFLDSVGGGLLIGAAGTIANINQGASVTITDSVMIGGGILIADSAHITGNLTVDGEISCGDTFRVQTILALDPIGYGGIDILSYTYVNNDFQVTGNLIGEYAEIHKKLTVDTLEYDYAITDSKPYYVWVAMLDQSGTNAPTAQVLECTLPDTALYPVHFVYSAPGEYEIHYENPSIDYSKAIVFITNPHWPDVSYITNASYVSSKILVSTYDHTPSEYRNNYLEKSPIEIRFYK